MLRVGLAIILGGIIGVERQLSGHSAGLWEYALAAAAAIAALVVSVVLKPLSRFLDARYERFTKDSVE